MYALNPVTELGRALVWCVFERAPLAAAAFMCAASAWAKAAKGRRPSPSLLNSVLQGIVDDRRSYAAIQSVLEYSNSTLQTALWLAAQRKIHNTWPGWYRVKMEGLHAVLTSDEARAVRSVVSWMHATANPPSARRYNIDGRTRVREFEVNVAEGDELRYARVLLSHARRCQVTEGVVHWLDVAREVAECVDDESGLGALLEEIADAERRLI